jgi:hypothetical protein
MDFYIIEPDVPGFLKETRRFVRENPSPSEIDYVFECWPDDDILRAHSVILVSERLSKALLEANLSGFRLKSCIGSKGDQFEIASPGRGELPKYLWLDVVGRPKVDDFGISDQLMLVISQRALEVLQTFSIERSEIFPV